MTVVYSLRELSRHEECEGCGRTATLMVASSSTQGTPHSLCGECLEREYPEPIVEDALQCATDSRGTVYVPPVHAVLEVMGRLHISQSAAVTLLGGAN